MDSPWSGRRAAGPVWIPRVSGIHAERSGGHRALQPCVAERAARVDAPRERGEVRGPRVAGLQVRRAEAKLSTLPKALRWAILKRADGKLTKELFA